MRQDSARPIIGLIDLHFCTKRIYFTSGGRRGGTIKPQTDLDHATVGGAVLASRL